MNDLFNEPCERVYLPDTSQDEPPHCPECGGQNTQDHPIYADEWECNTCKYTWGPKYDD